MFLAENQMEAYEEIEGVEFPVDSGAGEPGAFWYPHSANPEQVTRSFALSEHWTGKATVRDNYETVLGQRVLRVLFEDKVAVGVEYVAAGAINASGARVVSARKEVIVAAGTIHTPQILEASGIGGSALLEEAGIDVVADLPGKSSQKEVGRVKVVTDDILRGRCQLPGSPPGRRRIIHL